MKANGNQAPNTRVGPAYLQGGTQQGSFGRLVILLAVCFYAIGSRAALDCDRLPAAAMKDNSRGSPNTPLSHSGRTFLGLVEVGMTNLGPEFPASLANLKRLVSEENPTNPSVNLRSPLALALGDRSQDEQRTRIVKAFVDVPIDADHFPTGSTSWENLFYVGETSEFFVLLVQKSVSGKNKVYGVSKSNHDFIVLSAKGEVALWHFNQRKGHFELKVHETFENRPDGKLGVRIDYETREFIAWTLGDQLLISMPVQIATEGGHP